MTGKTRLLEKQFQAPCNHYFPDVVIEKIVKRGESFLGIYDCKFCGLYENPEDISGLDSELMEILENEGELERATAMQFMKGK